MIGVLIIYNLIPVIAKDTFPYFKITEKRLAQSHILITFNFVFNFLG